MERGDLHKRDVGVNLQIAKIDQEQRKAYGWVAIVESEEGEPIIDSDGHVIPIDVLEKAVHRAFTLDSGAGKGGDLHERRGVIDVIESCVVTAEKRAAEGSPFSADGPAGWWAGFRVNDDATWELIKGGQRPELSLRGSGAGIELAKRNGGAGDREAQILITQIELNKLEWFSTVDRGAGGDARHRPRIVLWKRAQEQAAMDIAELKKAHKDDQETAGRIDKLELAKQMTPELLEILSKLKPEEQAAVLKAIEQAGPAAAPEAKPEEVAAAEAPAMSEEEKTKMEEQKRELSKRDKEIADLRKRLDDSEERALTIELTKRVKDDMPFLPGKTEEWVELIKAARKGTITAEQAEKLEERLIAMSKAMRQSPHLRVLGSGADPGVDGVGTAKAEALTLAKRLIEKEPELGEHAAMSRVYAAHPELYKRVKEEAAS